MNDDAFNLSIRRFLKQFGVQSQRVIERAVEDGIKAGTLKGTERFTARAVRTIIGQAMVRPRLMPCAIAWPCSPARRRANRSRKRASGRSDSMAR